MEIFLYLIGMVVLLFAAGNILLLVGRPGLMFLRLMKEMLHLDIKIKSGEKDQ